MRYMTARPHHWASQGKDEWLVERLIRWLVVVKDKSGADGVAAIIDVGFYIWDAVAALEVTDEVGDTHCE